MWIILKNADDVVETYKKVAELELAVDERNSVLRDAEQMIIKLSGKITGLELENETLRREVEHWKLKHIDAKRRVRVNKDESSTVIQGQFPKHGA